MRTEYELFLREVKKQIAVRNLTQLEVAHRIRTHRETLSQYLSGRTAMRAQTAFELARILGISLDKIIEEAQK